MCSVTAGNGLRVAGDNTEGLGEEMDRDPKRAGHGAYWHRLPHCCTRASSATETPVFPVCVYVLVSCTSVCTQACLCCLCLCVCLARYRHRGEGDRTWDMEQPEEEARGIHRLRESGRGISAVPISRTEVRKGWPVATVLQVPANRTNTISWTSRPLHCSWSSLVFCPLMEK